MQVPIRKQAGTANFGACMLVKTLEFEAGNTGQYQCSCSRVRRDVDGGFGITQQSLVEAKIIF